MTITGSSVYSQTHSRFCDSSHFLRPKWKDETDSILNWTLLYLKSGRILTSNHRLSIFCASFPLSLFFYFLRTWERTNFSLILPRTVTTKTLWMLKNLEVIYKNIVLGKLRLNTGFYMFQPARYMLNIRSTEFCSHTFQTIYLLQTMYRNFQLQHLSTTIIPNNRYNRSNNFHSNQ